MPARAHPLVLGEGMVGDEDALEAGHLGGVRQVGDRVGGHELGRLPDVVRGKAQVEPHRGSVTAPVVDYHLAINHRNDQGQARTEVRDPRAPGRVVRLARRQHRVVRAACRRCLTRRRGGPFTREPAAPVGCGVAAQGVVGAGRWARGLVARAGGRGRSAVRARARLRAALRGGGGAGPDGPQAGTGPRRHVSPLRSSVGPRDGARASPSRMPAAISRRCGAGRSTTAITGSSPGRRSGRATRSSPPGSSSSRAREHPSRATGASPRCWSTWTRRVSRVQPLPTINGMEEFSHTFFEEVRVPKDRLIGELNGGWTVAMDMLRSERGGIFWMFSMLLLEQLHHLLPRGRSGRGRRRSRGQGVPVHRRSPSPDLDDAASGGRGDDRVSGDFDRQDPHGRRGAGAVRLRAGIVRRRARVRRRRRCRRLALPLHVLAAASIYGGSGEIQRNIVADQLLGLRGAS